MTYCFLRYVRARTIRLPSSLSQCHDRFGKLAVVVFRLKFEVTENDGNIRVLIREQAPLLPSDLYAWLRTTIWMKDSTCGHHCGSI